MGPSFLPPGLTAGSSEAIHCVTTRTASASTAFLAMGGIAQQVSSESMRKGSTDSAGAPGLTSLGST
jgi:hypothetical protein